MERIVRRTCPNTMTSLWNMSTASAPIQATEAMVKYWINREKKVQLISFSVRSIPIRKKSSIQNMAIHSCRWNLDASFWRIFLWWDLDKYTSKINILQCLLKPSNFGVSLYTGSIKCTNYFELVFT